MCRPGRYVGAAELSFFPHVQGAPTWLWTHPQAASCDLFVSIVGEGSATPLINAPPPRKTLEPATPSSIKTDEHRVRHAAQTCPCGSFHTWTVPLCVCHETQMKKVNK